MVEDRITALEQHTATLERRIRDLEGRRTWNPTRPEAPAGLGLSAPRTEAPGLERTHGEPWPAPSQPGARDPGLRGTSPSFGEAGSARPGSRDSGPHAADTR